LRNDIDIPKYDENGDPIPEVSPQQQLGNQPPSELISDLQAASKNEDNKSS